MTVAFRLDVGLLAVGLGFSGALPGSYSVCTKGTFYVRTAFFHSNLIRHGACHCRFATAGVVSAIFGNTHSMPGFAATCRAVSDLAAGVAAAVRYDFPKSVVCASNRRLTNGATNQGMTSVTCGTSLTDCATLY